MICPECGAAMVAEHIEVSRDGVVKEYIPGRYECPNGHHTPPITEAEWDGQPQPGEAGSKIRSGQEHGYPVWNPEREMAAKRDLADLVKGLADSKREVALVDLEPPESTEVEAVDIRMTHGELSVLAMGASETSTKAQREHAREVLHGYAAQAFDSIADRIIHGRPE